MARPPFKGENLRYRNSEKDHRFLRNRVRSNSSVVFIIIFVDLMKNRISSEYGWKYLYLQILGTTVLIAIVENTQAQYFDNFISKLCASVLNNNNTVKHQLCIVSEKHKNCRVFGIHLST